MNRNVILILVILLILVLAGAGLLFMSKKPVSNTTESQAVVQTTTAPTAVPSRSLRDLLTAGVAQKCTYTLDIASASAQGAVLVSGGKMRGDMTTTVEGQPIVTHMIVDGTTSYVWIGDSTTGFKMSIDPTKITPSPGQTNKSGFDPDQQVKYDCTPWVADSAQFDLPKNVKFSDFSTMTPPKVSTSGAPVVDKCAACNYLTGDDKTQCLSTLGCN